MSLRELHKEIDRNWDRHLAETRKLLRIPSVSMTGEGIEESAEAVAGMLSKLGIDARLYRGSKKSHPLVTGYLDVGSERTGILYGMYDVMPAGDLDEWDHPPFGATIVRKKPYGKILVNRGVYNSKGALAGMLLAVKTMLDKDEMPLNLHFVIEGEEERGGHSLPRYVKKNRKRLSEADVAFGFDYSENTEGVPVISLGLKGVVYFDLVAEGNPDTGGPMSGEVHSGEASWVHNPAWRLVQALSTLVDEDQAPAVDGMLDDVRPPDEDDRELIRKVAPAFDAKAFLKDLGVAKFKGEGTNEEMITQYLFGPSINICGLSSGYSGEGTKTVMPPKAMAKVDIRTVPDMTTEGTRDKVMAHLRRRGFTDIKMRTYDDYPWSKVSPRETISEACVEAMRYHGKEPEVLPMMAGSAPFYLFDQVLGIPWGGVGLGFGARAHAPNEFAVVKGMREFEKSVITVVWKYFDMASAKKA
ncbi:MAG: family metallo-hydrolase [Candidatus Thermoplasmatota archaeon]|nr:family metallo-hydrolase [Candidatus Thermoplasmatota archaeon]